MPLPGGPANKMGNRYEHWWTVAQLVRILDGEAGSIRLEVPGVHKVEFVLDVGNCQELHQAKRSHPSGKWSLASLQSEGLLQAMFDQLGSDSDRQFVFVSGSDAPELRELTERARAATNPADFESDFIGDTTNQNHFRYLTDHWRTDPVTAYDILRRIEVRTMDERGMREQVQERLQARFPTHPDQVYAVLRSLVEDSIHATIQRNDLIAVLKHKGFQLRQLVQPQNAPALVAQVTDHYLRDARRKLIQDRLVPRAATQSLLARVHENANAGAVCLVVGKAGSGKTGCVIEFVEALRSAASPIALAFRLDMMNPVASTQELGRHLGLDESPALVLAAAAETKSCEAVLVIDQLDAVTTTSGRNADILNVVEDLVREARGWFDSVPIRVVLVCREFDWDNDHRLRRLRAHDDGKITVGDFSAEEVERVLATSDFRIASFDQRQLDLLRLPQNLKLFLDAHPNPACQLTFASPKDLFDSLLGRETPEGEQARCSLSRQLARCHTGIV